MAFEGAVGKGPALVVLVVMVVRARNLVSRLKLPKTRLLPCK